MIRYTFSDGKWYGTDGKVCDMATKLGKEKYLKLIARMAFSMVNDSQATWTNVTEEQNKAKWTKATKAQLTDELIKVTAELSHIKHYHDLAVSTAADYQRVINALRNEIKTSNEAYAAMELRADKADSNLTDLFRTVKIVKATVNGVVIDGEDERDHKAAFQNN